MSEHQIVAGNEQAKYFPFSGVFHLTRNSFRQAGQDSFTKAPTQNPDRFQQLINTENLHGILERRRGYTLFNSSFKGSGLEFLHSYSFRSEALGLRSLVFVAQGLGGGVVAVDELGNVIANPIYTPNIHALPRMVLSRNYGYFNDIIDPKDAVKWDGTTNSNSVTQWGIDINQVNNFNGPVPPLFGTNNGGSGIAWTNPNNITLNDGNSATVTLPLSTNSQTLAANDFIFNNTTNVPIRGIRVDVTASLPGPPFWNGQIRITAYLTLDGTTIASIPKTNTLQAGPPSVISFGGPTDPWIPNITPAQVFTGTIGVFLVVSNGGLPGTTRQVAIDFVQMTIFQGAPSASPAGIGAGNITLASGRIYFYAFQNSSTGHTSDLSPPSSNTGPVTSQKEGLTGLPTSTDPQVDRIVILATADGGDETTLFFLASLPNGTATYTDNTAETDLLTANVYQETDINGFLHGIANNKLPPLATFPTKHKGRLYMAKGSILYYSKNLTDVTTSTGLITSKWEETWPAANQNDKSETAETVQGLLSDGETLWIGTERAIRRLIGDSPQNFQEPEIAFNETGLLNQEVWKIVFYEGQPVGSIWLTPDFRCIASDFNTYEDIGGPVQDILNSIDPTQTITNGFIGPFASFVSQGPADYYILYIPSVLPSHQPIILVYNLRTKLWTQWSATDEATTALFNLDANGEPQWLFTALDGSIYFWDSTIMQDRVGATPVSYPVTMQTSWLDFGDPSFRKAINQALITSSDSNLTLGIRGAVLDSQFLTGGDLVIPATPVITGPFQELFVPLAGKLTKHKWYQLTFTSPSNQIGNVLSAYNLECIPLARF